MKEKVDRKREALANKISSFVRAKNPPFICPDCGIQNCCILSHIKKGRVMERFTVQDEIAEAKAEAKELFENSYSLNTIKEILNTNFPGTYIILPNKLNVIYRFDDSKTNSSYIEIFRRN